MSTRCPCSGFLFSGRCALFNPAVLPERRNDDSASLFPFHPSCGVAPTYESVLEPAFSRKPPPCFRLGNQQRSTRLTRAQTVPGLQGEPERVRIQPRPRPPPPRLRDSPGASLAAAHWPSADLVNRLTSSRAWPRPCSGAVLHLVLYRAWGLRGWLPTFNKGICVLALRCPAILPENDGLLRDAKDTSPLPGEPLCFLEPGGDPLGGPGAPATHTHR